MLNDLCRRAKPHAFHFRFISILKVPFKISFHHPRARQGAERKSCVTLTTMMGERREGEADMARIDFADMAAALGEAPAADTFYELGMMYSIGRSVPVDYVMAHKWFNLAAIRGNQDAIRLRREIADQMSEDEIAAAQRAARAWLKAH
jgi:TPR repeat protein